MTTETASPTVSSPTIAVRDVRPDTIRFFFVGPGGGRRPYEFLTPVQARQLAADLLAAADQASSRA